MQSYIPCVPLALALGVLVSQQTLLQASVPDAYRGRILGAAGTTQSLLRLVGLGLSAALADAIGILPLMNLAGIFWICVGLLAWIRQALLAERLARRVEDRSG